jgi:hypothetical protein
VSLHRSALEELVQLQIRPIRQRDRCQRTGERTLKRDAVIQLSMLDGASVRQEQLPLSTRRRGIDCVHARHHTALRSRSSRTSGLFQRIRLTNSRPVLAARLDRYTHKLGDELMTLVTSHPVRLERTPARVRSAVRVFLA